MTQTFYHIFIRVCKINLYQARLYVFVKPNEQGLQDKEEACAIGVGGVQLHFCTEFLGYDATYI